ncbi:MAG: ABC transporter substrate-binding protein [Micromonosporaceae bacterium]
MSVATQAALACVLVVGLAGCGGGATTSKGSNGLTKIDVGIMPITSVAALKLGIKKGFFKKEGLDVKTHVAQSGAALIPAVANGQYQFAFSNNISLMIAYGKGMPLRIVRTANSAGSDPSKSQEGLAVAKDSPIKSLKQLEGKTIAVNGLNNTPHLADLITLERAGVDPKSVKFVEVGYPDMPLALEEGRVDAADLAEPFLETAVKQGANVLTDPYRQVKQDLHLSSWFTTQQFIGSDNEVVRKFAAAVDKSNAYARANTDEIREYVPTYLDVEPATAKKMGLPNFPQGTETPAMLKKLAGKSMEFEFMKKPPKNVAGLLADVK